MYTVEFECKKCGEVFAADWDFGDEIICPHCKITWETDYDTDWDDNVSGPWLTVEAKGEAG